ncbi:MAG: LytR/AlgR family response regulator transcription factor [Hyphomicrobiales bacterium]
MISCIIIEDQPPAQRILQKYIKDIGTLNLKGIFNNAIEALEFLKKEKVDLLFLDIHLPKISGLNLIQLLDYKPQIILTTAFPDYALESFEYDVLDYLLKPFSFDRFVKSILKYQSLFCQENTESSSPENNSNDTPFIFVKSGHDLVKVDINSIEYIKSEGDYTSLFSGGKRYLVNNPLKYWLNFLTNQYFFQVHKSYVVNINFIDKISGNQIYIQTEIIPIGRAFKDKFINALNKLQA